MPAPSLPSRDVLSGGRPPSEVWQYLMTLPDANGRTHGIAGGSLDAHRERGRVGLKPTAAALASATRRK